MRSQLLKDIAWRDVLPRLLADLVVVHASMIAAMAISVIYQTGLGNDDAARAIVSGFLQYYRIFFWFLSPIFPIVFLLHGFYTRTRSYASRHKVWVIARGVLTAAFVFFSASSIIFSNERVARSVAVPFMVLASVGISSMRLIKDLFVRYYEVKPKPNAPFGDPKDPILVVGGAGYIGSLLVERLLDKGYTVRVLDKLLYGDDPLRRVHGHPRFELAVGDCRNIQDVVKAVQGMKSIVHLAAIVGDPACEQDRATALEINYAATRMLIEVAKGHGISRFVFASSCSVYGATDLEMDESSPVHPVSLYGETKVKSERALLDATSDTFHPTILRYATVFGLGYRPRFDLVVNLLTAKARQEGVITIYNGQQWRPFIHVQDVVDATVLVLEAAQHQVSGQIFNVGDSRLNHTLSQVGSLIRELFPATHIEHIENADRRNYRVRFDKLQKRLGFSAKLSLRDGILEMKRAFDEGLIDDYTELRYNNQRLLMANGSPGNKDELDAVLMAAFAMSGAQRKSLA